MKKKEFKSEDFVGMGMVTYPKDFKLEINKNYQGCECGDYDEGCLNCARKNVKEFLRLLRELDNLYENGKICWEDYLIRKNKFSGDLE